MLELINRYCHGFVALPVIHGLRKQTLFSIFNDGKAVSFDALLARTQGNSGHLKAALRLLESLEILALNQTYRAGSRFDWPARLPDNFESLLRLDFSTDSQQTIDYWLDQSLGHWSTQDSLLADFLDGLWLLPLFFQQKPDRDGRDFDETFHFLAQRDRLRQCFLNKGWIERQAERWVFSAAGRHLCERIFVAGTVFSYRPMLANMGELLFGDVGKVFCRDAEGHENHLDRLLNVQASGFQHERYFKDCQAIIVEIFNQTPIETQPDYIADMGCGDGTLLKRVYRVIQSQTERGRQLDRYPLMLIGADYNQKALSATAATLAEFPHTTIQADIGNPARFLADLQAAGIANTGKILHIRSFLDHDRPYIAPMLRDQLRQRAEGRTHGVYIDSDGQAIPAKVVYQSLVEHLTRWSAIIGDSGAMFLEVHSLPPQVIARYLDQCENLHFDAYHAFSGQMLADADEFLWAAAESGLFPRLAYARHYPRTLPFSRITLNWFEKRPYRLRPAFSGDLEALVDLDQACWPVHLTAGRDVIAARLARYPQGQYVLEQQGEVLGALYTQRIKEQAILDQATFLQLPQLHDPQGSILQILGMNIKPSVQHLGLGDQILDFLLYVCGLDGNCEAVVGISRCKQFAEQGSLTMPQYLQKCRDSGQWDTVLHFHVHHGAEVVKPIADYWPDDVENQGYGILVRYSMAEAERHCQDSIAAGSVADAVSKAKIVNEAIRTILGESRKTMFSPERALMEMGLDSLDLLELRTLLSKQLGVPLEPMFFFSYGTANAISAYFNGESAKPSAMPPLLGVPEPVAAERPAAQQRPFDVAIVGMACRFPGGVRSADGFWQYLRAGLHGIGQVPPERWDYRSYQPDANPYGGFIDDVDRFDAEFFNVTPREARLIDPQHRLLLETAWEAFEQAGINPRLAQQTGVFVGLSGHDYELLAAEINRDRHYDVYHAIGNSAAMAAGRLAYFFGFNGPAVSVDTACSSSLLAVRQACESLRRSDCRLALAGGVNLMLAPDLTMAFSKSGMLAADGRCKTFDAEADGYVRSEGCGLVLLKPLTDAVRDRDQIFAVIKGSAVNQDGASNGITAPNGLAQEALMRQALIDAKLPAAAVSVLEAHGTGTPLGDPIEIESVARIYGEGRTADNPLVIGSVKTNIGHTEAAAGVAGLIKLCLALKHRFIPPHLHFKHLNPRIPLAEIPATVPLEGMDWPKQADRLRTAAISAFGFSGTNVHMIIAEAEETERPEPIDLACVLPLSAQTPEALQALVQDYKRYLTTGKSLNLLSIAATAATGRQHFDFRLAIAAANSEQLLEKLNHCGQAGYSMRARPETVFLFTGQGAQYLQMARGLYASRSYFRQIFDQCSELFAAYLDCSIADVLFGEDGSEPKLQQTGLTQPALFTLEYALAKQWQQWGVEPDVMIGHSIGEYVAACLAGVFDLNQAVMLVAKRGQVMQALPANGKMAAVNCRQAQLAPFLNAGEDVVIACFNAPERLVVSGSASGVDRLLERLTDAGFSATELKVSHAFHSPLMAGALSEFRQALAKVQFSKPAIRIISTLSGQAVSDQMSHADYWLRQIVEPVDFTGAIDTLRLKGSEQILLEVGPRSVLTSLARQVAGQTENILCLPALDPGVDDDLRVAENVGRLYELGLNIDWQAFYRGLPYNKVSLPTYPFQRQRYWLDDVYRTKPAALSAAYCHPLLGQAISSPLADEYQASLGLNDLAWLAGHSIDEEVILPMAAYLEMAVAAAGSGLALKEIVVAKACAVSETALTLHTVKQADNITIYSRQDGDWRQHFSCSVAAVESRETGDRRLDTLQIQGQLQTLSKDDFYRQQALRGYRFGGCFQSLEQLYQGRDSALAYASCNQPGAGYRLHPVLLDAAIQCALMLLPRDGVQRYMPFSIERFALWGQPGSALWSLAKLVKRYDDALLVDIDIYDSEGLAIAALNGVMLKRVAARAAQASLPIMDGLYRIQWQHQEAVASKSEVISTLRQDFAQGLSFEAVKGAGGRLNQVAVGYFLQALEQLGMEPSRVYADSADLMASSGVQPRFSRLFGRMLAILREAGCIDVVDGGWRFRRTLPLSARALAERLRLEYPALAAEVDLLARCGEQLASVWRGERDPLPLVFPADNPSAITDFYRHSPSFAVLNQALAVAVAQLARGTATTNACRILEIGAGTGSATYHILNALDAERCRYTFTDVSRYFTEQAKQAFAGHVFVDYRILDIAADPQAQGFAAQSFDIVIASNVLHATTDLHRTLSHCRQLLAGGGHLVLLEGVEATPWIDAVFGLTEGWWAFNDNLRRDYPLLNSRQWQQALQDLGLEAECLVADHQDAPFKQALVLASAPKPVAKTWLVAGDQNGLAEQLSRILEQRGIACFRLVAGEQFKPLESKRFEINLEQADDYRQAIAAIERRQHIDVVVNCWPLSLSAAESRSGELLMENTRFMSVGALSLIQALLAGERPASLLCHLTRHSQSIDQQDQSTCPEAATLWGINKVSLLEHPELNSVVADLDDQPASAALLIQDLLQGALESQQVYRKGQRFVPRLAAIDQRNGAESNRSWRSIQAHAGAIDALRLVEVAKTAPGPQQVEIKVQQAGLNFIDVMDVLGLLPFEREGLGMECVGVISRCGAEVVDFSVGQRVIALAEGAFTDELIADAFCIAALPDTIPSLAAATLPVAFVTARHALLDVAKLQPGQRVLIHAAAGGTGMAAVQVALAAGAEVYATASVAKWPQVRQLGVELVMNSRDLSFVDQVKQATGGESIDIVFNSLTGDFIPAGLSLLKAGGCFLEIGKRELLTVEQLAAWAPAVNYQPIDVRALCQSQPRMIQQLLQTVIAHIELQTYRPLPYTRFEWPQMQHAFRFMQQAKHVGKIVLTNQANIDDFVCDANASYLITGGLKGLGLYSARWLVEKGAKRLFLLGRSVPTEANEAKITELRALGAEVEVLIADVSDEAAMQAVFQRIRQTGRPLKGIVHSVGVLSDGALQQQNWQRYRTVLEPKITGAWLLHRLSQADDLDFFLMYSSVASLLGSAGQSNHAAANAFLDALAAYRRARGLAGQSINWCGWSEIGSAAELKLSDRIRKGLADISPEQGGLVLNEALKCNEVQLAALPIDWPVFLADAPMREFFAAFGTAAPAIETVPVANSGQFDAQALRRLSEADRGHKLKQFLTTELAAVLGMDVAQLNALSQRHSGFFDLGLDSLTSVEFKNKINHGLAVKLPASAIFDFPTIQALSGHLMTLLANDERVAGTTETASDELEGLSLEQAAELLAKELG